MNKSALNKSQLISTSIDLGFIFLFSYSSLVKFLSLDSFAEKLLKSPLIGLDLLNLFVYSVPFIEAMVVILLAIKSSRKFGRYLMFFLLSSFTVYLINLNNLSGFVPCSCGGLFETLTFDQHVTINIVFLVLAGINIFLNRSKP